MSAAAVLGAEAAYALLKPVPHLEAHDPTAILGDPSHPGLRIVVLGDSSVVAPGVDDASQIWVSLVARRVADLGFYVDLTSLAVGGSMAHNLIDEQMEEAILLEPDVIIVSVGANDVIKGVPRRVFAANLDRLVAELADTGALLIQSGVGVLGTIPRLHPPLSSLISARSARFDRIHHRVSERYGTHVIEQRSDDREPWFSDPDLWSPDQFHVSPAGHQRWANTAWNTVGPLIIEHFTEADLADL